MSREVVLLRYYEEFTLEEIADTLGIAPGKSRIERVVVIRDGKLRDAQPHRLVDHLLRRVGPVGKSRVNVIVDHTHLMPESVTPSTKCF